MDYRKRAVEYKEEGHSFKELRVAFKIPAQTYYDWKEKFQSGYYEEKRTVERKRLIDKNELRKAVEERPDAYLRELAEPFGCTAEAVFQALKKWGLPIKKTFYLLGKIRGEANRIFKKA